MELSAAHVGELVRELAPLCEGRTIQKVEGLPPRDLLLVLLAPDEGGPVRRLRVSADPDASRLHLQIGRLPKRAAGHDVLFRELAVALEGATLTRLEQLGGDRIVRLAARAASGTEAALVAELWGRHANLVLLDGGGRVRALLRRPKPAREAARHRLRLGEPYRAPEGGDRTRAVGEPLSRVLPAPPTRAGLAELAPLSWRIEFALGDAAEARRGEALRRDLAGRLERRWKNARRLVRNLREKERALAAAERLRQDGELIKANLATLRRGMKEARVQDFYAAGTPSRRIELDPRLSPMENAERLFARYRKHLRSGERLPQEIGAAEAAEAFGREFLGRARDPSVDPVTLELEALEKGWLKPRQSARPTASRKKEPRLPYRRFTASGGSEVRVGRSARDNDLLTFRHARGNDLWLHTADAPGSHVVLRTEKGREPREDEVLDAAHLAVHYSPLKGARRATVHVARCKEVKKPRQAPPGLVTLAGGRTLEVRLDAGRLERLLRAERRFEA